MVFHMVIDAADGPGDIAMLLLKVRHKVLGCETEGEIYDANDQVIGRWAIETEVPNNDGNG